MLSSVAQGVDYFPHLFTNKKYGKFKFCTHICKRENIKFRHRNLNPKFFYIFVVGGIMFQFEFDSLNLIVLKF